MQEERMDILSMGAASIANPKAYKSFLKVSGGRAFLYLLLLTLFAFLATWLRPIANMYAGVEMIAEHFEEDLPYFYFENEELHFENEEDVMPLVYYGDDDSVVYIDTRQSADRTIVNTSETGLFVFNDQIKYKKNPNQVETTSFVGWNFGFDKHDVLNWLPKAKAFIPFMITMFFAFSLVGKLVFAFIVSAIALFYRTSTKAQLTWGQVFKLSIFAMTASTLLSIVIRLTLGSIAHESLVYLTITSLLLYRGMKVIGEDIPPVEYIDPYVG